MNIWERQKGGQVVIVVWGGEWGGGVVEKVIFIHKNLKSGFLIFKKLINLIGRKRKRKRSGGGGGEGTDSIECWILGWIIIDDNNTNPQVEGERMCDLISI